jgi:hypothetical protein
LKLSVTDSCGIKVAALPYLFGHCDTTYVG